MVILVSIGLSLDAYCDELKISEIEACGKYMWGDQSRVDKVTYTFAGKPGDVKIVYDVWDVEYVTGNEKVEIILNGNSLGFVPETTNNNWSEIKVLTLPDKWVNDHSKNTLIFDHVNNPPKSWWWAVRNVNFTPRESEYGKELKVAYTGDPIGFAWDENIDYCFKENIKPGYRIYYGTESRKYNAYIDVGNVTEYEVSTGFEVGVTYYFTPTAY